MPAARAPQAGLDESQLPWFVLDRCRTAAQVREALYEARHYIRFSSCHFLIADADSDAFVWEREAGNLEHVTDADATLGRSACRRQHDRLPGLRFPGFACGLVFPSFAVGEVPGWLPMPPQWRERLEELGCVFARRSAHRLFMALACGLILADRGTVTGMAAAAGIGHQWRRACWFSAAAKWDPDSLGLAVARLIVQCLLSPDAPLTVAVDGTFFRRWGKHVHEARWAYDGAAQGGKKTACGNTRVIAALVISSLN